MDATRQTFGSNKVIDEMKRQGALEGDQVEVMEGIKLLFEVDPLSANDLFGTKLIMSSLEGMDFDVVGWTKTLLEHGADVFEEQED